MSLSAVGAPSWCHFDEFVLPLGWKLRRWSASVPVAVTKNISRHCTTLAIIQPRFLCVHGTTRPRHHCPVSSILPGSYIVFCFPLNPVMIMELVVVCSIFPSIVAFNGDVASSGLAFLLDTVHSLLPMNRMIEIS